VHEVSVRSSTLRIYAQDCEHVRQQRVDLEAPVITPSVALVDQRSATQLVGVIIRKRRGGDAFVDVSAQSEPGCARPGVPASHGERR
jgi:hypothetical protein